MLRTVLIALWVIGILAQHSAEPLKLKLSKEDDPKLLKENEPKLLKKNDPKLLIKNDPKLLIDNDPKLLKENDPKLPKENEPKLVKESDPKLLKNVETVTINLSPSEVTPPGEASEKMDNAALIEFNLQDYGKFEKEILDELEKIKIEEELIRATVDPKVKDDLKGSEASQNEKTEDFSKDDIDNFFSSIIHELENLEKGRGGNLEKILEKNIKDFKTNDKQKTFKYSEEDESVEQDWWRNVYEHLKSKDATYSEDEETLITYMPHIEIIRPNSLYEVIETIFLFLLTVFVLCLSQQMKMIDTALEDIQKRIEVLERKRNEELKRMAEYQCRNRTTLNPINNIGDDPSGIIQPMPEVQN